MDYLSSSLKRFGMTPVEAGPEQLNCIAFNQDSQCLAIGHKKGYEFYPLAKNIGVDRIFLEHRSQLDDTIIVERLLASGLAMVVSRHQPRTMHVRHVQNQTTIHDQRFSSSILNIKVNRTRVAVCLEESIHIYNLKDMKKVHTMDTPGNPSGLMDLSLVSSVIAYPGSATTGRVHIFDADNQKSMHTFSAHESPLAAIRLDTDGAKLATASVKGTVIRVFSVKKEQQPSKIFEFRRGVARAVTIYNLAFSADASLLVSSSNTETVHIFKLQQHEEQVAEQDSSASSWMGWMASTVGSYLPAAQMLEKSFATAHLPAPSRAYAVLPTIEGHTRLVVATADGYLYYYKVDPSGGECEKLKQYRIGPEADAQAEDPLKDDAPPLNHLA